MGATATLSSSTIEAVPGTVTSCEVQVCNTGPVVDDFTFEVLGDAGRWATVEPPMLKLFPAEEKQVHVQFRPPRAPDTRAGAVPFAVKVVSKEDPQGTVVEEGAVDVAAFSETFVELLPRTSRGRLRARHELALDNRGNRRVNANLSALDPDDRLGFAFDPPGIVAEPGTAAFARLTARPVKRFLRGPAKSVPFQVVVEPEGEDRKTADGIVLQESVLPQWLNKALLALLALLVLAAIAWFAIVKPTVESSAEDAVKGPLAEQSGKIADLEEKVTGTTTAPVTTDNSTDDIGGPLGGSFDKRLAVDVKPGATSSSPYKVDDGKRLSLTDVLLQNPQGDGGTLRLKRGRDILLEVNLANFRDLDYHFVSPVVFSGGEELVLEVSCLNPNPPGNCKPAAYLTGFLKN